MGCKNQFKAGSRGADLLFMASSLAFILLIVPLDRKGALASFCIVGVLLVIIRKYAAEEPITGAYWKKHLKELILTAVIVLAFAGSFYDNWSQSSRISAIANILHLPEGVLVALAAAFLAAAACWFVMATLCVLGQKRRIREEDSVSGRKAVGICALTAVGVITLCSKSSFLYPLNDWVDANCFFTVGKSMMNGVVVYRDLWEQKGPFLYFLHGLASLISDDSFLGVYFIEIIAAVFFLYFSYQALRLFVKDTDALITVPLIAAVVYTSPAFCHGDSAEELCLPFLAYALWVSLKSFKHQTEITMKEYLLVGISSGLVFWTKYTMVGFYCGWFIVPALCLARKKQWKRLGLVILTIAAGVMLATVPFIVYFGLNHAIGDWLEVYIYNNLFLYAVNDAGSVSSGLAVNLLAGFEFACSSGAVLLLFSLLGSVWIAVRTEWKIALHYFFVLFFTFVVTFMGGRQYDYYTFVLSVFVPFGLAAVICLLTENTEFVGCAAGRKGTAYAITALCIAFSLLATPNRYLLGVEKEELPQYQFKEIIEQKENPTLLNYGFLDGGFYTASEIIPNCKAFCKLNIPLDEMNQMQEDYIRNGLCDFVVTRDQELDFDHYECVAQSQYRNKEGMLYTYYLYQQR